MSSTARPGKMIGDVIIEALKRDLHGEEFTKTLDQMTGAIVSAVGLHPALAGIIMQGKMSNSTEILRALQLCLLIEAPQYREMLLGFQELFKAEGLIQENQCFDFLDKTMVALSGDPTGVADVGSTAA